MLEVSKDDDGVQYAKGFSVEPQEGYTSVWVNSPWPNAQKRYHYLLVPKKGKLPKDIDHDLLIRTPVERVVVTSTTHIPSLESLGVADRLVGFPGTPYISAEYTRERIDKGLVKELGQNESLNTEVLIDLNPSLVVGFALAEGNKTYATLEKMGIPVVYNGDWIEYTPLGRAEWIKFFAPFFEKEALADSLFGEVEKSYLEAVKMATNIEDRPTALSGAMYKDIWYMPAGDSYQAQLLEDARVSYLWEDSEGTGSLSLSVENVLEKGKDADVWIGPAQFESYRQMAEASEHYTQFKAFKEAHIYTFSSVKGATGGQLFYELAPSRPDLVLKDLVHILHPEVLPDHTPFFLRPLRP